MIDTRRSRWLRHFSLAAVFLALAGADVGAAARLTQDSSSPRLAQEEARPSAKDALREAEDALAGNRLYDALKKCRQALDLDPKSADAYYVLGIIQRQLGKPEEARQSWLHAVEISPSHIDAHIALGKLDLETNNLTGAAKEFGTALKLGDSHGEARYGLGLTLMGQSKYSAALPLLLAAVQADPTDRERLFTLIGNQFQLKQTVPARQNLRRLEKL